MDHRFKFQTIVVDNGSTDSTFQTLESEAQAGDIIIRNQESKGWGGGLKAGLLHAEGDYILVFPSDLQYPLESIRAVLDRLSEAKACSNVAIFSSRKFRRDGVLNSVRGRIWAGILRKVLGSNLEDLAGQLRAHSRIGFDYETFPDSFLFDAHFALAWHKSKMPYEEVPVSFERRALGRSSNGNYISSSVRAIKAFVQYSRDWSHYWRVSDSGAEFNRD